MQAQAKELTGVLDQLASLLESEGETRWSKLLRDAVCKIEAEDRSGIELFLGAFCGAESFRSFAFGKAGGAQKPAAPAGPDKNRILDNLRRRAQVLADFIQRTPA